MSAAALARSVRQGDLRAVDIVKAALDAVSAYDEGVHAFTQLTPERALAEAEAVDRLRRNGASLPSLSGVPYAVKDLFDLKGLVTLAGSKVRRRCPPAVEDAALVERLGRSGGVCLGTLNMDEFAYGFTTENTHYGPTRNPHDGTRTAGGSSGGCGAAVAAGMAPLALGSDTNGSIRVPASLCGIFGLRPTYGRLPREGSFPFASSLDVLGPFARSVEDLALAYDACRAGDADPTSPPDSGLWASLTEPTQGLDGLRVARLTGYFDDHADKDARAASRDAARALGAEAEATLADVAVARAAAFVMTAAEGGTLHLDGLRERYADYEPLSRDRFLSGAVTPAAWYLKARAFRWAFRESARELWRRFDLLVAPATPCCAPLLGTEWLDINGRALPARPSLGLLTQPISLLGVPVAVAPMARTSGLPLGVQIIGPPWHEDWVLRAAAHLERVGVAGASAVGAQTC